MSFIQEITFIATTHHLHHEMTNASLSESWRRLTHNRWFWRMLVAAISLGVYLSTLQWGINGSTSPYMTDVGEIQNALPRWGTIHFTGYPLYTLVGSIWVTLWRLVGLEPAASASILATLFGVIAIVWLAELGFDLDVPYPIAAGAALMIGLSLTMWVDASIAELNSLSMVFTFASLHLAIKFGRSGSRNHLLWLVVILTQGFAHQRAVGFIVPAVAIIIAARWQRILPHWRAILLLSLLAPLTYLYLAIRGWQGAAWTFNAPGTWQGLWELMLDTKATRIVQVPTEASMLRQRAGVVLSLLHQDLPVPLLMLGWGGLGILYARGERREALGLAALVLAYLIVSLIIWEGEISRALLSVKVPAVCLAGVGLACWALLFPRQKASSRVLVLAMGFVQIVACIYLFGRHRPQVLDITRDPGAEQVISRVQVLEQDEQPTTVMTLWGHDYWALAYAQAFRGQLTGINLVDHNAPFEDIVAQDDRLVTLEKTLYVLPPAWWEKRLGNLHMSSAGAGLLALAPEPIVQPEIVPSGPGLLLDNGIEILYAHYTVAEKEISLVVYWRALDPPKEDYAVAVHLLAQEKPEGPEDILAQADQAHPVAGWYPTSTWSPAEIVRDDYRLPVPTAIEPVALRLGMYRVTSEETFENTEWLVLPLTQESKR